jgi:SSS family solute:Na+ symporter
MGLLLNPVLYALFKYSPALFGEANPGFLQSIAGWSFLDRMALCFGVIIAILALMTAINPLKQPVELPVNENMNLDESKSAKFWGIVVVLLTIALYAVFF